MSTNLSNENINDEQDVNVDELFAASYAGNSEEVSRLQAGLALEDNDPGTSESPDDTAEESEGSEVTDEGIDGTDNEDGEDSEQPNDNPPAEDEVSALRAELHRAKSDAGRVPFLNRRVQELERKLSDMARAPASVPEDEDLPQALKAKLDKLRELDPELAETMEESYRASASKTAALAKAQEDSIRIQREREDSEFISQQFTLLTNEFPEAPKVFQSEKWKKWKDALPPAFRALAESSYASEVAEALRNFKVDAERHFGGYEWAPAKETPTPERAAAVAQSRAQRLSASSSTKSTPARRVDAETDAAALFEAAYKKALSDRGM